MRFSLIIPMWYIIQLHIMSIVTNKYILLLMKFCEYRSSYGVIGYIGYILIVPWTWYPKFLTFWYFYFSHWVQLTKYVIRKYWYSGKHLKNNSTKAKPFDRYKYLGLIESARRSLSKHATDTKWNMFCRWQSVYAICSRINISW